MPPGCLRCWCCIRQLGNKSSCWYCLHHPRGLDAHIGGEQNLCLKHLGIYLISSYHSPLFQIVNSSLAKPMHMIRPRGAL